MNLTESSPTPHRVAESLTEAQSAVSFARYMERCLFDPEFGYYSSGKVVFGEGEGKHFWTYPQRMTPIFGWMLAEFALRQYEHMRAEGTLDPTQPFTLLELGAGNGDLAADTLDYLHARVDDPAYQALAQNIRYVIGERSAALRERQRERLGEHVAAGRGDVREIDAQQLSWDGPFQGMVFANELLDAFPCERLRIHSPERIHRLHVQPTRGGEALASEYLWRHVRGLVQNVDLVELEVPLSLGWVDGEQPADLEPYLETLKPLIQDLETLGKLPVDLCWGPGVAGFIQGVASVLTGAEDRRGIALLVDYGGSSRHVLDPDSLGAHFRVYGADKSLAHQVSPYVNPSQLDMTWDIDFTEVSRLAMEAGLETVFVGHQNFLEAPPIDLWSKVSQKHFIQGRMTLEGMNNFTATLEAHKLVQRFRLAGGFRAIALASSGVSMHTQHIPEADPLMGSRGLGTVGTHYDAERFAERLKALGLPEKIAACLKPGGDVIADLCDHQQYAHRAAVLRALEEAGFWVGPGELPTEDVPR